MSGSADRAIRAPYYGTDQGKWHLSNACVSPQNPAPTTNSLEPYGFSDFNDWVDIDGGAWAGVRLDPVMAVARALAGTASARLLPPAPGAQLGQHAGLPAAHPPPERPVHRVLGVDEFARRKGKQYATILIDAASRQRIDHLPDRKMESVTAWLPEHRGVEIACRDGASDFAQAVSDADPAIAQCMDRWHLWHGLAAWKEVAAHSPCWAKIGPPVSDGWRATTTRERWYQVHQLLDAGVGLLGCSRRLNLALNTVKRYARHSEPEQMTAVSVSSPCAATYRAIYGHGIPRVRPDLLPAR
ncbi:transposase, partial [Streptomyces spororaveus]